MTDLQLLPHEAERNPIVFARNGEVFANSREVAAYFGKEHRAVLASIDNLLKSEASLGLHNFMQTPYIEQSTGQSYRSFDMDETGFTLLAMGFTGKKALLWKLKYIEAFKLMRERLAAAAPLPQVDFSDPRILIGTLQHLQGLIGQKDEVIAEQGERLKKLNRLEGADGTMCLTDAAKTLGARPHDLIKLMQARRWIYKRTGNKSWVGFQDKLTAGFIEHDDHIYTDKDGHERVATRALVTAKGLVRLAELLEERPH